MTEPFDKELDDILEAAASWHTRLDLGTANEKAFERWRAADPRHAAAFARIVGTDASVDDVKHLIPSEIDEFEVRPAVLDRRQWLRGAFSGAGAVLVAGGGFFAFVNRRAHAQTRVGERRSIVLPDSSHLDLNTDTKVSWRFSDAKREIWLDRGEIAVLGPASLQRLTIYALDHSIEPEFGETNVRIDGSQLEVVCLHGETMITPKSKLSPDAHADKVAQKVRAGQGFSSTVSTYGVRTLKDTDIETVEAWQSDEIVLSGLTLATTVAEYNRYLTRKIVIRDPSLAGIRLGGRFSTRDTSGFLQGLTSAFGIKVLTEGDVTVLTR
ncbi:MAG: DUF4880 domain-containing protein [Asticcacaulis sp.]|uniref:FecR family protein n=1 Tax=Asticcacaulis sp. TaxID=1872648 RepID=UPI0039E637A0